ncbi:hypothetical protein GCM10009780_00320 [Actinomadura alba]
MTVGETVRRTTVDRGLLMDRVAGRPEDELIAPYLVRGGPLGDFCESLRDLVAHVLMWDEISLAVLTEARHGRAHWSLAERWEEPEVGASLNVSGVAAGRELPVDLLLDRFTVVRDALLDELSRYDGERWSAPIETEEPRAESIGALAQHVMTIPRHEPYWHAAIHLGELAEVTS